MRFASAPAAKNTALTFIGTADGSLMTILTTNCNKGVSVPKSIARSPPYSPKSESKIDMISNQTCYVCVFILQKNPVKQFSTKLQTF